MGKIELPIKINGIEATIRAVKNVMETPVADTKDKSDDYKEGFLAFGNSLLKVLAEIGDIEINKDYEAVTRCKDCKHYYHGTCTNDFALNLMRPDYFCCYGEGRCEE